jgi:hypothetical protein
VDASIILSDMLCLNYDHITLTGWNILSMAHATFFVILFVHHSTKQPNIFISTNIFNLNGINQHRQQSSFILRPFTNSIVHYSKKSSFLVSVTKTFHVSSQLVSVKSCSASVHLYHDSLCFAPLCITIASDATSDHYI